MTNEQNPAVRWPFGAIALLALLATGASDLTIVNDLTFIDGATVPATADRTLNLTAGDALAIGARVVVKSKSTATETLAPGTNVKGETLTGVAGKTQVAEYIYDGVAFIQVSKSIQID
jgi:hypothetical protein